jgi:hypothetical protein
VGVDTERCCVELPDFNELLFSDLVFDPDGRVYVLERLYEGFDALSG